MLCPRRNELGNSGVFKLPAEDVWREDDTCSYCGSLKPDKFLEYAKAGAELGPTDKSYKVYIDYPETQPDVVEIRGASNADERPSPNWVAATSAPDDVFVRGWQRENYTWVLLQPRGPVHHGKFYFQHLSPEQQQAFIDLVNAKTLKIGYPGYFYRTPFFVAYQKPEKGERDG